MALIRILCDGGGSWGFGNLRRSATLGWVLAERGHRVRVEALSDGGQTLLPRAPAEPGEASLLVLDLPYAGDDLVRRAHLPVVALDYQGEVPPAVAINIWRPLPASTACRQAVGLEYAIIRPELAALADRRGGEGAVVLIGGGDADGLGERVALRLLDAGERQVTLIDGPLATVQANLPPPVQRLRYPPDLDERMAACGWAVTSGGTAMMEMMCLGKAVHVVPRTDLETGLARQILARGGVLGVGLEMLAPPRPERRAEVAAQAARLVDGRGPERIVAIIESFL